MPRDPATSLSRHRLRDGRTATIRPIRPEDENAEHAFFSALSAEARHKRFIKLPGVLNDDLIHFFTHIDYERHVAFVAEADEGGGPHLVGDARYVANPDGKSCEFAIVVADAWRGTGLAALLMEALFEAARARGLSTMEGFILRTNERMRRFVERLGFSVHAVEHEPTLVRAVRTMR